MLGRKTLLAVGAVVAGLLLPAQAMAQFEAFTDANLNLRIGPGTHYGVIDVIPYGDVVDVYGCLQDVAWCDVEWWGLRGWVSARYLVQPGTSVYLPQVYARIGVPIISFSFSTYHDRYYRDRPWYKKRDGHWRGRDWRRGDRPKRRSEERRDAELPQQQQREVEPSRQQRQIERAKQKRQKQLQEQLQEAERPRKQREVEPSRQQREIERAKQKRQKQLQEAEQPRQSERTRQPRQVQEAKQPRQGKKSEKQGRSGSDGPPEEQLKERGQ
jgi:uncharacterized protein YraI